MDCPLFQGVSMGKVGLVAGAGILPLEFIREAKKQGEKVVVFGIRDMADPCIEKEADKVYWVEVGQYKKYAFFLMAERIHKLAFLGRVKRNMVYARDAYDDEGASLMKSLSDKTDGSIFDEITSRLKMIGVEVIEGTRYLSHLVPPKGVMTKSDIDGHVEEDIAFGYKIAKKMADEDIGQTVIIKDKAIVAVEAMEGTNSTIDRAGAIGGEGCVMVKVCRPDQDLKWDIPTVGVNTMEHLSENKFSALAIESEKMFLLEKDEFLIKAEEAGIAVKVL